MFTYILQYIYISRRKLKYINQAGVVIEHTADKMLKRQIRPKVPRNISEMPFSFSLSQCFRTRASHPQPPRVILHDPAHDEFQDSAENHQEVQDDNPIHEDFAT